LKFSGIAATSSSDQQAGCFKENIAMTAMMPDRRPDMPRSATARTAIRGAGAGMGHAGLRVRQLGANDLPAIERHLRELGPSDRRARFLGGPADAAIAAYVRELDPSRAVLIGAFDYGDRLVGLAAAHPAGSPRTVEVGVSIDRAFRRCGLGRRLVGRALALAFAFGAQSADFIFAPDNRALTCLVRALGGRIDPLLGHASIDRPANGVASKAA
jgi:ribosomal protein S18 acetylase RimI-like enzyme